ncbi:hypothetical protein EG14_05590 [Porphyromonas gingivalis]|nr:hypothetical protein EG14_05590 [Porphyromonas gingivalis]
MALILHVCFSIEQKIHRLSLYIGLDGTIHYPRKVRSKQIKKLSPLKGDSSSIILVVSQGFEP